MSARSLRWRDLDLPVPEGDPNRMEAIVTTGVGLGADRSPFWLTRRSQIQRGNSGTEIGPVVDGAFCASRDRADAVPRRRRDQGGHDPRFQRILAR